MKRGEYLTAYERRRRLREEFRWWRNFGVTLGAWMLVAFVVDAAAVGAVLGVAALGAFSEAGYVRAKLERISR